MNRPPPDYLYSPDTPPPAIDMPDDFDSGRASGAQKLPIPIPEDIGDFVSYDPQTGLLTWKVRVSGSAKIGGVVGSVTAKGYRNFRCRGVNLTNHRVAWFLAKGEQPPAILDHRNGKKDDNRIDNLRAATLSLNGANSKPRARSLPKGVVAREKGRFHATIRVDGRPIFLGAYSSVDEAAEAYASAAAMYFGEFARAS